MPPRLPISTLSASFRQLEIRPTASIPSSSSSITPIHPSAALLQTASISGKAWLPSRKQRMKVRRWLESRGGKRYQKLDRPVTDAPFELNAMFKSEPVLHNSTCERIWSEVMENNMSIKAVSAMMDVDMRRVAAVVRLKEVEKQWIKEGKQLALPYHDALSKLLPLHRYNEPGSEWEYKPFEPINELHVHGYTMQQLFLPVAESRHFTRADAAKAFHNTLLPADERIPHPELVQKQKDLLRGMDPEKAESKFRRAAEASERAVAETKRGQRLAAEKKIKRAPGPRAEFRFQDVNVDHSGRDGRSPKGVGWRYGNPLDDRKRGVVKIPTSVG